jgi:hypothetical protein
MTTALEDIQVIVVRDGEAAQGINLFNTMLLGMQEAVDELLAHQIEEGEGEEFADGFDMLVQNNRGRTRHRPRTETPEDVIAPQPRVTLQEWEVTKELRCRFCPHPSDTADRPPQVPLEGAPWSHFRCGCRVHTICYGLQIATDGFNNLRCCPVCNTSIITEEQRLYIRQSRPLRGADPDDARLKQLWEEDEVFREEVRELSLMSRAASKAKKEYAKGKVELIREWRRTIMPHLSIIKHQRQIFSKRLINVPYRRAYFTALGKYKRKFRALRTTYNLGQHAFFSRFKPRGLPRLKEVNRWTSWRDTAWSIFRVRM